jgi:hypothetical protein
VEYLKKEQPCINGRLAKHDYGDLFILTLEDDDNMVNSWRMFGWVWGMGQTWKT